MEEGFDFASKKGIKVFENKVQLRYLWYDSFLQEEFQALSLPFRWRFQAAFPAWLLKNHSAV